MSNGNRLSIPELEDQIAALSAQLRSQQQREPAIHWYTCPRCSSFYTSIWGCGCPLFPGEKRQTAPSVTPTAPADFCDGHCTWLDHHPSCPRAHGVPASQDHQQENGSA